MGNIFIAMKLLALVLTLAGLVSAVYKDEAYVTDWHKEQVGVLSDSNVILQGDIIGVFTHSNVLASLNASDGSIIWRRQLEFPSFGSKHLASRDSHAFITSSADGYLTCWNASSGGIVWRSAINFAAPTSASSIGEFVKEVHVYGTNVYVLSSTGKLSVFDVKSGHELWSYSGNSVWAILDDGTLLSDDSQDVLGGLVKITANTKTGTVESTQHISSGKRFLGHSDGLLVLKSDRNAVEVIFSSNGESKVNRISSDSADFEIVSAKAQLINDDHSEIIALTLETTNGIATEIYENGKLMVAKDTRMVISSGQNPSFISNTEITSVVDESQTEIPDKCRLNSAGYPLFAYSDENSQLVQFSNGIICYINSDDSWVREEALSAPVNVYFSEHTESEEDKFLHEELIYEENSDILSAYVRRSMRHAHEGIIYLKAVLSELNKIRSFGDFVAKFKEASEATVVEHNLFGYSQLLTVETAFNRTFVFDTDEGGEILNVFDAETSIADKKAPKGEFSVQFGPNYAYGVSPNGEKTWEAEFSAGYYQVAAARRDPTDKTINIGHTLGDRRVLYKYLHPNILALAAYNPVHQSLVIQAVDSITGRILHSKVHTDIVSKPDTIDLIFGEHWIVYSYQSELPSPGQKIVVWDLYESLVPNERWSNDSMIYSSFSDYPAPAVISRAFLSPYSIGGLGISKTKHGITSRDVIAYLSNGQIATIPKRILDARRPDVADKVTPEEGLIPYDVTVLTDDRFIISHERVVIGAKNILTQPAVLESTSLVCAYGLDLFYTRITPSMPFDSLSANFDKSKLVLTVVCLFGLAKFLQPIVVRKQTNARWQ